MNPRLPHLLVAAVLALSVPADSSAARGKESRSRSDLRRLKQRNDALEGATQRFQEPRAARLPSTRSPSTTGSEPVAHKDAQTEEGVSLRRLLRSARKGTLRQELRQLMNTKTGQLEIVKFSKSSTWRVLASTDTAVWTLYFTGDPAIAAAIATGESATKWFWRYGYESLWANFLDGRYPGLAKHEKTRDLIKALGWRVIGSADTFLLGLGFTGGDAKLATSIAIAEAITKIGLDFGHERGWRKVIKHKFPKVDPSSLNKPAH